MLLLRLDGLGGALSILTSIALFGSIAYFIFGGSAGLGFNIIWVLLIGGWVLYDTSNVLHRRNVQEHVAASVDLLVDFVYMLIYIAMILLNSQRN